MYCKIDSLIIEFYYTQLCLTYHLKAPTSPPTIGEKASSTTSKLAKYAFIKILSLFWLFLSLNSFLAKINDSLFLNREVLQ